MAKGSDWERNVCKYLSKWLQGTEKPYIFWRTGGSGSVFTTSEGKAGDQFAGDIYAVRPEGEILTKNVSIECKNGYASVSLDKFFKYNKSDSFREFWIQTVDQSRRSNKYPMLVYRKKGFRTPWIGISKEMFDKISDKVKDIRMIYLYWIDLPDTFIFEMSEFFERIKPEVFEERINVS